MSPNPLARLLSAVVTAGLLATGCATLGENESGWTEDEDSIAERQVVVELEEARNLLVRVVQRIGSLGAEAAECVVDGLVVNEGVEAALALVEPDVDGSAHRASLVSTMVACEADHQVAERWIPELGVDLAAQSSTLDCVAALAADWSAARLAELVLAGGLADDETLVDELWLADLIDRCDAGAAMMAAASILHPQVGADARTPSRWLCAAAAAPSGAFDDLYDPAVVADGARAEAVETRIAPWFDICI